MTVRIIKGTTEYEGVPYYAASSQDTITDIDDAEAQRFIDLGVAERVPDPPKPPLQIFPDSPEKIRNKIAELEKKLSEAQAEHEALLDDSCEDVAGVTKKIEAANGKIYSLRALVQRMREKLKRAEENEQREKEKIAVKNLEKATSLHKQEAEKILNGLLSDIAALETKASALNELRERERVAYHAAGAYPPKACPLLGVLGFIPEWEKNIEAVKAGISRDLSRLDEAAAQTPAELKNFYNSKRFKNENELSAELREREKQERLRRKEELTA